MYVCPICNKEFQTEEAVVKHLSACWKEQNPYHKSKPAPRSEDVTTVEADENVFDFFNSFKEVR